MYFELNLMTKIFDMFDIFCFVTFTTLITIGLTYHPCMVWLLLLWLVRSNTKRMLEKNTFFDMLKFVGVLIGIVAICFFHNSSEFSNRLLLVLGTILQMNIIMAVLIDIQKHNIGNYMNALVGLVLTIAISLETEQISITYFQELKEFTKNQSLCIFPLSHNYIVVYNMWNAAFTYSSKFSLSTRMILIGPYIIAHILSREMWLCARCLSLMLNMVLRATETSKFYVPGKTCLTAYPQSMNFSQNVHIVWCCINTLLACIYILKFITFDF